MAVRSCSMIKLYERRPWYPAKILLLLGPGGAGKSSLGTKLAPLLNRNLVDLDEEFRHRRGDISAFLAGEGYDRYKIENSMLAADIVAEAAAPTLLIASSGFLTPDNPEAVLKANHSLSRACYSICLLPSSDLERSVSVIVARQLERPFARARACEEAVIRARYSVYAKLGDLVVFSTASPCDIAAAVAHHSVRCA